MSLITRTDVTAVKLYENFILAGIGSTVNVFDKVSTNLLQRLTVLNGQKIYGFKPSLCSKRILVFGGKQFSVLSSDFFEKAVLEYVSGKQSTALSTDIFEKEVFFRAFEPIVCDDWLHSAVWIDHRDIALLTAHNVVQIWDTFTCTLKTQHTSNNNSILYSGLLVPLNNLDRDVLVMAGTVYSEVIIHKCGDKKPLHNLKGHKGVILSIKCKPELENIIVTTSDDRSVRIWGPDVIVRIPFNIYNSVEYWRHLNIICRREVYGHSARVMRSCIRNNLIVSAGEDSAICYWDFKGNLMKKVVIHQTGCIWSMDSDDDKLITGGGDGGLILHPLTVATYYPKHDVVNIGIAIPKKVEFTARGNLVITDENNLIYYDVINEKKSVYELKHETTYKLLSLSSCKQLIAVGDMSGKLGVFVESCKGDAELAKLIDSKLNIGKILSMHWAGNRHLIFCTDDGNITVFASNNTGIEKYANFALPPCKEALLTAAAMDSSTNHFVVGDRNGNIHIYIKGQVHPIKSFSKVHGRYGPRSLMFKDNNITSTGRDHTIKYFSAYNGCFKLMKSKDLPFAWIEKFLDKDQNLVCGFQERVFVVHNVKDNSKVLEVSCGGGHRSFDAFRCIDKVNDSFEEIIKLVYLKDFHVNLVTFELSKIVSNNILNGSHAKEINCLVTHNAGNNTIFISGGEDTTLRISSINEALYFQDEVCFKHLSSIRTLKSHFIDTNTFLLVSAGGRAQICIKEVEIENDKSKISIVSEDLVDYLIKGTDKDRKGNQPWRNCYVDFDPEMRIMDLDLLKDNETYIVFAGCSDAYLRLFTFKHKMKKLELLKTSKYHATCILKTRCINIFDQKVLITCTTRGDVAFWNVTNIIEAELTPFFVTKTNKSGINSLICTSIEENQLLIGTGGDDNTIHLMLLEMADRNNLSSIKVLHTWSCSKCHSSQITGLCLDGNYILSASIDQRVTLLQWGVKEKEIECMFLSQTYTNVADVQGMDLMEHSRESIKVCVFGKGMEVLVVPKPK